MSQLPEVAQIEGALAMYEGSLKYGYRNYRHSPVRASVYTDALRRHLVKWETGQDYDEISGINHLGSVIACAAILLDAEAHDSLIDDRDISWSVVSDYLAESQAIVRELQKLYGTDTRLLDEREG